MPAESIPQKPYGIIYLAFNTKNGKKYIGQTRGSLKARIQAHWAVPKQHRRSFQRALHKYGISTFAFAIIDSASTLNELNEKEQAWVRFHQSESPCGYNLTAGGGSLSVRLRGMVGPRNPNFGKRHPGLNAGSKNPMFGKKCPWTAERGKRMVGAANPMFGIGGMKGKKHSAETRERMRAAAARRRALLPPKPKPVRIPKPHHNLGKAMSDEQKRKISETLKRRYQEGLVAYNTGRTFSEETRRKLSEAHKKIDHPGLGVGRHRRGPDNPCFGRPLSAERRAKISAARIAYYQRKRANANDHGKGIGPSNMGCA